MNPDVALSIRGLTVDFHTPDGPVRAVDAVSYDLRRGETLAVVGESGSGKSVTALAVMGLVRSSASVRVAGEVWFEGRDLLRLPEAEYRAIRGRMIAMIFQDPMTSLNPGLRVGFQIAEAILVHHRRVSKRHAAARAVELLKAVGIPQADRQATRYPHEFSGGMRQRAMIAMAIANSPSVLIADEPTTALDVTIQAQVIDLLRSAQQRTGAATILITHDLGLAAELADRVVVMYAGAVAETADVRSIFHTPRHPYTVGLLASQPRLELATDRLAQIPGNPPSLLQLPAGCRFHPRCPLSRGRATCRESTPTLRKVGTAHESACHFHEELGSPSQQAASETDPASCQAAAPTLPERTTR